MDTHELAWAAGFFDGEGATMVFIEPSGRPRLNLKVGQTELTSIERLREAFGFGRILGPYKLPNGRRAVWYYNLTNFQEIQAAIALMWRWLGQPKRQQAEECLVAVANYEALRRVRQAARLKTCPHGHDKTGQPIIEGKRYGKRTICIECMRLRAPRYRKGAVAQDG